MTDFINSDLCSNICALLNGNVDAHINNEEENNLQVAGNIQQPLKNDNISVMQIQVNLQENNNLPSVEDKRMSNVYITVPLGSVVKYSMNYICRLCATVIDSNSAINIFSSDQLNNNLACKINKYLPIVVYEADPFPKTVCNICVIKLNQFHDLVEKCASVEEQLRQTYAFDGRYLDELNKKIHQKSDSDILKHEPGTTDNFYSITEFQYMENLVANQLNSLDNSKDLGNEGENNSEQFVQDHPKLANVDVKISDSIPNSSCRRTDSDEQKPIMCHLCRLPLDNPANCIEHWDQHYNAETTKNEKPCLFCHHVIHSKADLEKHVKIHFRPVTESPAVNPCNSREKTKARQQKVLKNKMKMYSKLLCCKKCKQTLSGIDEAIDHCHNHKPSNVKFYPCVICAKGIGKSKLREHISMHYPIITKPVLSCDNCNNLYPDEKTLKYHRCTKLRKYKCSQCKQGFKSEDRLKFHEDFHQNKCTFCDICKKDFKFESRIYLHFAGVHNGIRDKPYCCDICGKTFTWLTLLNSHKRTHTNERPFKCAKCDARFCNKYSLNGHMPSHDDHPQMYCDKCDYHTGRKQNLQNHVSRFHKEINSSQICIQCRICNEIFPNEHHANVEEHSSRHLKSNMSVTINGPDEFTSKPFQEIMVSKLYQCERCERCFSSIEHLTQHRTTHASNEADSFYQCRLCDIFFSKHDLLVKHQKVHVRITSQYTSKLSVLTVISCDICGMECVDYRQLLNHKDRANCMLKKITGTLRPRKVLIKKHLQPLKTHQLFVNANGLFECPSCQRTYKNRRRYRLHLATHATLPLLK